MVKFLVRDGDRLALRLAEKMIKFMDEDKELFLKLSEKEMEVLRSDRLHRLNY